MNRPSPSALSWTLRIGVFMCFVGHGAFGIMTKEAWVPYFAVAGIGRDTAYHLMPLIGIVDIIMGFLALIRPMPVVFAWMTLWAIWTAALRPISGEPFWEALERAGNYGAPAALLILGAAQWRRPFARFEPAHLSPTRLRHLRVVLAMAVLLLLGGHGALGVNGKHVLTDNYASIVSSARAVSITAPIGWLEIGAAVAVSVAAWPGALVAVGLWKVITEALFLAAGASAWEWVERGGSYAAPIALAMVILLQRRPYISAERLEPTP